MNRKLDWWHVRPGRMYRPSKWHPARHMLTARELADLLRTLPMSARSWDYLHALHESPQHSATPAQLAHLVDGRKGHPRSPGLIFSTLGRQVIIASGHWGPWQTGLGTLPSQVVAGGRGMGDVYTRRFRPHPKRGEWVWVMRQEFIEALRVLM